jgi:hypothetical protein
MTGKLTLSLIRAFEIALILFWRRGLSVKHITNNSRRIKMAVIVKGEITITKGFNYWKSMVFSQKERMAGMGMQFLFAGTEKSDPTKLLTIIKFDSVETMQAFGGDEELTKIRREAGVIIESGVMTPISDEFFTNYPEAFIQH